ncbi:MAG: hypothetical protein EOP54_08540 [Sphingobacteriales bacterium]|nr:MAG: hypothetical protein EOP54_08540 [Sphingobacteriales bacterium]
MTINNTTGEFITQEEAVAFTHDFQSANPDAFKCFFAGSEKIKELMDQKELMGIRIYRGYDKHNDVENLVLVGVDSSGNDMCSELFLERLAPCPASCAQNSILVAD